jgi:hypothetical protein
MFFLCSATTSMTAAATTYVFGYGSLINMLYNKELVLDPTRRIAAVNIKNLERAWCQRSLFRRQG